MPRAVAYSHKQKKKYLKDKRALKRGEEVEDAAPKSNGTVKLDRSHAGRSQARDCLSLHSRFLAIPPDYAVLTRNAAYAEILERPIPDSAATFPLHLVDNPAGANLTVPSRPKFDPGQTKREVERNEEEVFAAWLETTRSTVDAWLEPETGEIRSPSSFETNLEVWRQLWRVVEASSIVLLLLDARCPAVHCPPSLRSYLQSLQPRREIILVLTKSDLVDDGALTGWRTWLADWWGRKEEPQIVSVTSYDTDLLHEGRLRPHIPAETRAKLVSALKTAHARLLAAPEWQSTVRQHVHWEDLEGDAESFEYSGSPPHSEDSRSVQPLTFGLVGQPNVGKSSLLNALLGTTRVRASKTPGKTKHWQTILWGSRRQVRIVDCPGLVCPSLVPMELQAMSGRVLSIAQIPSLSACIAFAARLIPLERVFQLSPPPVVVDDTESKRTWRGPRAAVETPKGPCWTPGNIMDRRAIDRGMMTAKSGRPDNNRAADGMMRAIANGRVRWGFWPPGSTPHREGCGLWLGEWQENRSDSGYERDSAHEELVLEDDFESSDESNDESDFVKANNASFFAALSVRDPDDDE